MPASWNESLVKGPQALAQLPKKANGSIAWGSVRVAHLDTGFSEHPCFGAWNNGANAIIRTSEGKSFRPPAGGGGRDPFKQTNIQPPGHGTKTASVIAADSPGFQGIAPGVPLVPLRVTDASLVTKEVAKAIGKALMHVSDNAVAPIVSISLGYPLVTAKDMGKAVDHAYEKGVIIVAAGGQVIDRMTYPGKHLRTIGVGGITRYRAAGKWRHRIYAKYDRYGRIDTWAPAEPVARATPHPDYGGLGDPADLYGKGDGTSYAVAHVAAAAAIWCRHHGLPTLRSKYSRGWDFVEAFRQCLFKSERAFTMPASKQPHDSRGRMLDIQNLLQVSLPDAADLKKEPDLAADDLM